MAISKPIEEKKVNEELSETEEETWEESTNIIEELEDKTDDKSYLSEAITSSSSSVLTEILSPWRAAAKLHVQRCREKYIKEFGKDIHLHSDDSDTMIRLKEKITPISAQVKDKQRLKTQNKKISKSIPTAFDEWLKNKNRELKIQRMKINKQKQIKELKEAAEEAKEAKKRTQNVEKWRTNRDHLANEKRAIAKIKERDRSGRCNMNDITLNKMNKIPASEWEKIRQAAEDMQHIEPLEMGRLTGQGDVDTGKYLTKYIVKPDSAFRARYKHILEAAACQPTETILDGDHNESIEDPAQLPHQLLQVLKDEANKLRELNVMKENSSNHNSFNTNLISNGKQKEGPALDKAKGRNISKPIFKYFIKPRKPYGLRNIKMSNRFLAKKKL